MTDPTPKSDVYFITITTEPQDAQARGLLAQLVNVVSQHVVAGGCVSLAQSMSGESRIAELMTVNTELSKNLAIARARIAELESRTNPPQPLYTAIVISVVNIRDEKGAVLQGQLQPGTRVSVWSEGTAGDLTDRVYIDQPNKGRNIWMKNIKRDVVPNP